MLQLNRQGADVGRHYRSVILYEDDEQRVEAEKVCGVFVCIYMCVYTYIHMYIHTYIRISMYVHVYK